MKLSMAKIGKAPIPTKGKRAWLGDDACPGLLVRITATGHRSWWYRYSDAGKRQTVRLGVWPTLTLDDARAAARKLARAVADGENPAEVRKAKRGAPTLANLWDRYWKEHALPHKRSADDDAERWRLHVAGALGSKRVEDVQHEDIARLHLKIGAKSPGAANRVVSLLSKMFNLGEKWGMRTRGTNPARGVERYQERPRERYLSEDEYQRLFAALDDPGVPGPIRDAIKIATYTGMRIGRVLELTHGDVDRERRALMLADTVRRAGRSKPVPRTLPLSPPAWEVVEGLLGGRTPGAPLLPSVDDPAEPLAYNAVEYAWRSIRQRAGLGGDPPVRLHDLRHAFASLAAEAGMSLPQIGALLGHKTPATTQRYAHLADHVQRENTEIVGAMISAAATASPRVVTMSKPETEPRSRRRDRTAGR